MLRNLKRYIAIRAYLSSHRIKKLHLGCGKNDLNGWLNTDLREDKQRRIIFLDVTKKFPFVSSIIDYVFSEHLIEHLKYRDGEKMVRECFRVLRPGGKMRVSTPDLKFLIDLYLARKKSDLQKKYITWAVNAFLTDFEIYSDTFVINNFFYNWGHRFIYDYKTLKNLLRGCGFKNIRRFELGKSNCRNLRSIESHGRQIGEEFNRLETLVVEGTKPVREKKR